MTSDEVDEAMFEVVHTPNPCDRHHHEAFVRTPYPFMWFYRTEVRNHTDGPLRVEAFNAYVWTRQGWVASNVKGRELNEEDFRMWYGSESGERVTGPISPKGAAVCQGNWHGSPRPWSRRVKWWYRARDEAGKLYEAEAEIVSKPVMNLRTAWWVALRVLAVAGIAWAVSRGWR